MIISKIVGGIGNQMFQYAYGRFLSEKHNRELYLEISFYQYTPNRHFILNLFENTNINTSILLDNKQTLRIEDNFIYKNLEIENMYNYYLDGYWQSEKYFKEIEDIIKYEFSPSKNTLEKLQKVPLIDKNIVSLHIRRTDYLSSNGYHPVQSLDYYTNALNMIEHDYIFVFSDDIEWCRKNLPYKNMIFNSGLSDIEELHLMSMCKNNIIANSSFSWWGAWLNNNPNKIIISPSTWFGEKANLSSNDIISEGWIKI